MLRKVIFSFFAVVVTAGVFASAALAQSAPISGKVELKKADGTLVPIEGALVEVFRSDIKSAGPADKTDKKGQFSFAGLQVGGVYILSISFTGAQPTYLPGVKPGTENLKFTLSEGDGRRLTPDEVRQAALEAATATGGQLTEEQKKEQAEIAKKRAEIESKNAKIVEETKVIEAALKDGNAAYGAKNWDIAIAKYEEGVAANPTFAGSAPVLLNNKGAALRERAVINYNQNVRNTDTAAKIAGMTKVKADLVEAANSYNKAWTLVKGAPAGEISDPKIKEAQIATSLRGAKDTFRLMAQTEQVDEPTIELAKAMLPEYMTIETDVAKKDEAKLILGDLYRVAGNADNAIAEYRKVIEASPDNLDGLVGLGLSLVNAGFINNNKEQLQEGANFLQKFASAAPDTHKYKNDAVGAIEMLKTEQKIAPQKVAPAKRRGN